MRGSKILASPALADSFERSRETLSTDELLVAEGLQTLYVGQVRARLLRLLEDRGSIELGQFEDCVVHIIQDERGTVFDVDTDECNADLDRRAALSRAIRETSPLPLPPQGLAMGSYLTIDLNGSRYP